jgi:hypothetical protein
MYKFGKNPPRALESFGVAGLLDENCQILYESAFSTRHLGRVSDLVSARLRRSGCDELRLRALLLFSIFEAYRGEAKPRAAGATEDEPLAEPMVIECGIDSEKIAVGVSFTRPEGAPQLEFEKLLGALHSQSDRVVVRTQDDIRRVEIVALLGLPGKIKAEKERPPIEIVPLSKAASPPKASSYTELGDLDYPALLREDGPGKSLEGSPLGEIMAKGIREPTELLEALRARAQAGQSLSDLVRVSGTTQKLGESERILVKGTGSGSQGQLRVGGAAGAPAMDGAAAQAYLAKIDELERRLAAAELAAASRPDADAAVAEAMGSAELSPDAVTTEETEEAEEEEKPKGLGGLFGRKLFKKVWPFKKAAAEDDEEAEAAGETEEAEETEAAPAAAAAKPFGRIIVKGEEPEAFDPAKIAAASTANPEGVANNFMVEIQSGRLDRTLSKAQKEAVEIKKDINSSRAKRWMDGLMSELVQEKARLHDMAKKLNTTIRQKELDFRTKESTMLEELRRRDEMLRQKNTALNRTKDQVSQLNLTLERVKAQAATSTDDAHYKGKYQLSQKLFASTKEENMVLKSRVEELKTQLANTQLQAAKRAGQANLQEMSLLQAKAERAVRQFEEAKRMNVELATRLNEANKKQGAAAAPVEDARRRLENSTKQLAQTQRENESLQLRLDEMHREEQRLRKELELAKQELAQRKAG